MTKLINKIFLFCSFVPLHFIVISLLNGRFYCLTKWYGGKWLQIIADVHIWWAENYCGGGWWVKKVNFRKCWKWKHKKNLLEMGSKVMENYNFHYIIFNILNIFIFFIIKWSIFNWYHGFKLFEYLFLIF